MFNFRPKKKRIVVLLIIIIFFFLVILVSGFIVSEKTIQKVELEPLSLSPISSLRAKVVAVEQSDEESETALLRTQARLDSYNIRTDKKKTMRFDNLLVAIRPETIIFSIQVDEKGKVQQVPLSVRDLRPGANIIFYTKENVVISLSQEPKAVIEAFYVEIIPPGGDPRDF